MKSGKAAKEGDIPVECFKALATEDGQNLQWILSFCTACWEAKALPEAWRTSAVSLIFKKGDPAECDNYRPISLITVAAKLFDSMVKQRLLDAGAGDVLWGTQFGFRIVAQKTPSTSHAAASSWPAHSAFDWATALHQR